MNLPVAEVDEVGGAAAVYICKLDALRVKLVSRVKARCAAHRALVGARDR